MAEKIPKTTPVRAYPHPSDSRDDGSRQAREVVCDFLVGDNAYGSSAESLDHYFVAFAVAAREGRS